MDVLGLELKADRFIRAYVKAITKSGKIYQLDEEDGVDDVFKATYEVFCRHYVKPVAEEVYKIESSKPHYDLVCAETGGMYFDMTEYELVCRLIYRYFWEVVCDEFFSAIRSDYWSLTMKIQRRTRWVRD